MDIFISWSGESSRQIANAIKNWLPKVLQATKPYFTPQDIEKGQKWLSEILTKLNECTVGVICLTPENVEKPWILFEAGALSNRNDIAIVCPLLFNIKKTNISGPLSMFQTTEFNKEDFYDLLKTINSKLGDYKLASATLQELFDVFFPKLENEITKILSDDKTISKIKRTERSDRELLEELLELNRQLTINLNSRRHSPDDPYIDITKHKNYINSGLSNKIQRFNIEEINERFIVRDINREVIIIESLTREDASLALT